MTNLKKKIMKKEIAHVIWHFISICSLGITKLIVFQTDNQYIGQKDTLGLPVGEKLKVTLASVFPTSSTACDNEDVREKAMYFTQIVCDYPVSKSQSDNHLSLQGLG